MLYCAQALWVWNALTCYKPPAVNKTRNDEYISISVSWSLIYMHAAGFLQSSLIMWHCDVEVSQHQYGNSKGYMGEQFLLTVYK